MSLRIRAACPTDSLDVRQIAALLRELTTGLIRSGGFEDALSQLVRTSQRAIPGVTWCGVTVLRAGAPASVVASDPARSALDDLQYRIDGPAMAAIRHRAVVLVPDLRAESRWMSWTRRARGLGVGGVLCAPVDVDDHVLGVISLYAREPGVLTAQREVTATLLAEHAGPLLAAVRDRARQQEPAGEPDRVLADGELVGQAIAVIMTQRGCPAADALQVLRTASTALSIPLREVAERLVRAMARPRP